MKEKAYFIETQVKPQKPKKNNKKIIIFSLIGVFLIFAIAASFFILAKIKRPAPSGSALPKPAPATAPEKRFYFTRDLLFPGIFSINVNGGDLKSHMNDIFVNNLKKSSGTSEFIGFHDQDFQKIGIYHIKTGNVELIDFNGVFCDFYDENPSNLQILTFNCSNNKFVLINLKTKVEIELFEFKSNLDLNSNSAKYSPDKKFIFCKINDHDPNMNYTELIVRIDARDGKNQMHVVDLPSNSSGIFSPDVKTYVYTVNHNQLHLLNMELKTSEMVYSNTNNTFTILSIDNNEILLSFTREASIFNFIYKFNIKEKNIHQFEKPTNFEADNLERNRTFDSRIFFVQKNSAGLDNVMAYNPLALKVDIILTRQNISNITPLRYDSKVIFKSNDKKMYIYDIMTKSDKILMSNLQDFHFTVSPSGKRIATYRFTMGMFEVFDIEKNMLVFSKSLSYVTGFSFSHDCQSIFYLVSNGSQSFLKKMDALTGHSQGNDLDLGSDPVDKLFMSLDGNEAVFSRKLNSSDSTLVLVKLDTNPPQLSKLFDISTNSLHMILWKDNTIYLEYRKHPNQYFLHKLTLNDKKLEQVLDESQKEIKIDKV